MTAGALSFNRFRYCQAVRKCLNCGGTGHVKADCPHPAGHKDWSTDAELAAWVKENPVRRTKYDSTAEMMQRHAISFLKATENFAVSLGLPASDVHSHIPSDVDVAPLSEAEFDSLHRRHLHKHEMQQLAKQLQSTFTLDSFSHESEKGALAAAWCSPVDGHSFCERQLDDSAVVWLHPPSGQESEYLQH